MSEVICSSCFEVEDTTKRFIELPYVCSACLGDDTDYADEEPYNSGVPCQSALDSVQAERFDMFECATDVIDDLKMQLSQANLNIQVLEETIESLENDLTNLRLEVCNAVFGKSV